MAFGKIHGSFFDSSVNELDPLTRLVFIGLIVLSDRDGRLDITRTALARKVNLPLADVERAISLLQMPDPESRSPENDGARIVPLDAHRTWGWCVVNKAQYRSADGDTIREAAAERKRVERSRKKVSPAPSSKKQIPDTDTASHTSHKMSQKKRDIAFDAFWTAYPPRSGRAKGDKARSAKLFAEHVRSDEDAQAILVAAANYGACDDVLRGYRKDAERWIPAWREWLNVGPSNAQTGKSKPFSPQI